MQISSILVIIDLIEFNSNFFFFFDRWIVLDSMIVMDSVVVVISISILMNADRNWISIVKIVEIWLEKPNNVENVPIIHCRYTSNSISI